MTWISWSAEIPPELRTNRTSCALALLTLSALSMITLRAIHAPAAENEQRQRTDYFECYSKEFHASTTRLRTIISQLRKAKGKLSPPGTCHAREPSIDIPDCHLKI